jgi:pterin-4a-carbinolamine dehydratase
MSREKLSKQEIAAGLCNLDGWSVVKGKLHRTFEFNDFAQVIRVHEAGRARGRQNGSSPGLVQRVQQGHYRFINA